MTEHKNLRELVLSHSDTDWFKEHKANIMFELNHCELHHIDSYYLNLYNAGVRNIEENEANSSIAYLLGIVTTPPTGKVHTVGGGFPDIDSDVEKERRPEVFEMLREKYGEGFAHLGTLTYTGGKKAFKDAARIHGMGFEKANKISSLMPDIGCPPLDVLLEEDDAIKALYSSDPEVKEVWDDAISLSDCLAATGLHACFIADTKVYIKTSEDGSPQLMNIQDVKPGYYALTHMLRWKEVVETQVNKARKEDLLQISYQCSKHDGFNHFVCTSNHPIGLINPIEPQGNDEFKGQLIWSEAKSVIAGYVVIGVNDKKDVRYARRVLDVSKAFAKDLDSEVDVYNFTVLDDSSYIANGVVVHNCGVALSDRPLWEDVPLWDSKGSPAIQWEGNKIEETSNVVKLDILGLKTLTVLNFARELIKKRHGIDIDWYNLPMDNEAAYKVLWNERNYGIFQFEEAGMSGFVNACKPKTIHDIAVIVSTYRPKAVWGPNWKQLG